MMENEIKNKVKFHLQKIVENSEKINKIMSELKHSKGRINRSLGHKSGQYIFHSNKESIVASYKDSNGNKYSISINKN